MSIDKDLLRQIRSLKSGEFFMGIVFFLCSLSSGILCLQVYAPNILKDYPVSISCMLSLSIALPVLLLNYFIIEIMTKFTKEFRIVGVWSGLLTIVVIYSSVLVCYFTSLSIKGGIICISGIEALLIFTAIIKFINIKSTKPNKNI